MTLQEAAEILYGKQPVRRHIRFRLIRAEEMHTPLYHIPWEYIRVEILGDESYEEAVARTVGARKGDRVEIDLESIPRREK